MKNIYKLCREKGAAIVKIACISNSPGDSARLLSLYDDEKFSEKGVEFAGQLINLFTSSIGDWSFYIIAVAALATMFSTTITCLDGKVYTNNSTLDELFNSLDHSIFFRANLFNVEQ